MVVYCPRCWSEVRPEAETCPQCGAWLDRSDDDYTAKLIAALRHPEPFTQRRAAYVLGLRADAAAVTALIDVLHSPADVYVRGEAAAALGKIGGDMARAALQHTAQDAGESAVVRRAAAVALSQLPRVAA